MAEAIGDSSTIVCRLPAKLSSQEPRMRSLPARMLAGEYASVITRALMSQSFSFSMLVSRSFTLMS